MREILHEGRSADAIQHVLRAYRPALAAYFNGSSFRRRFDSESAESVVDAFFADQLSKRGFLESWLAKSSRFRYWLLRTFINWMRYQLRKERSEERRLERISERAPRSGRDTARDAFDAASARGVVREAVAMASERCVAEGRAADWSAFLEHFLEGRTLAEIAERTATPHKTVKNQVRHGGIRLAQAFDEVLRPLCGSDEAARAEEIARMKEALQRCHT
jgi:DNA-directed RNA polymerase specialized sigma24 family protein